METIKSPFKIDATEHGILTKTSILEGEAVNNGELFQTINGNKVLKSEIGREVNLPDPILVSPNDDTLTIDRVELKSYIESVVIAMGGNINPPSPTSFVTDDTAKTANWTNAVGYPELSDYERTLNGGTTVSVVTAKPFTVTGAKDVGQVGVRVKAVAGRNASPWLFNTVAFTSSGGGANENLLSGLTMIEASNVDQTSSDSIVLLNGGVVRFTGNSGDVRLRTNLRVKYGSKIAFRYMGNQWGMIGLRRDADQYGVEQGLGVNTSANKEFYYNGWNGEYPELGTPIVGNWYVGTYNEDERFSWETTGDGISFEPISISSDNVRPSALGAYLVIQCFSDGIFGQEVVAVQYSGFDEE